MDDLARYFDTLEIKRGASFEEIKRAYRDLAQVWHPDRYGHNPRLRAKAEEKLKNLNEAYQQLSAYSQRSTVHTPPPPKSSPPPQPSTPSPQPSQNCGTTKATDPPPRSQPTNSKMGCAVIIVVVGFIILLVASQQTTETQPSPLQSSYQPAPPLPTLPPISREHEELSRMKAQLEARIARKDAEFDRLQKWYQQGVPADEEADYRASLYKAQQEEQEIEALILTYNAKKKELDATRLSK